MHDIWNPWHGCTKCSEGYKDGYNLYLRMEEYMSNHLLFRHDHRVPVTNNESERLLRRYKRNQQQAVSFRGFESIEYLCQSMSMEEKSMSSTALGAEKAIIFISNAHENSTMPTPAWK